MLGVRALINRGIKITNVIKKSIFFKLEIRVYMNVCYGTPKPL